MDVTRGAYVFSDLKKNHFRRSLYTFELDFTLNSCGKLGSRVALKYQIASRHEL